MASGERGLRTKTRVLRRTMPSREKQGFYYAGGFSEPIAPLSLRRGALLIVAPPQELTASTPGTLGYPRRRAISITICSSICIISSISVIIIAIKISIIIIYIYIYTYIHTY